MLHTCPITNAWRILKLFQQVLHLNLSTQHCELPLKLQDILVFLQDIVFKEQKKPAFFKLIFLLRPASAFSKESYGILWKILCVVTHRGPATTGDPTNEHNPVEIT